MISLDSYSNLREIYGEQFAYYGPYWQSECHWCREMSDCFESPSEVMEWQKAHRCVVGVPMEQEKAAS